MAGLDIAETQTPSTFPEFVLPCIAAPSLIVRALRQQGDI